MNWQELAYKVQEGWEKLLAWWAPLPKWKWAGLAGAGILLLALASAAFGGTLWIGGNDMIIACNDKPNADGVHVCAAANTGQRGYCIPIPEGRFPDEDPGSYYCVGNQPGNKTYDLALMLQAVIANSTMPWSEVRTKHQAWNELHPPQMAGQSM